MMHMGVYLIDLYTKRSVNRYYRINGLLKFSALRLEIQLHPIPNCFSRLIL
jgi:hypothetical protein